ncbi:MAG: response regulator [Gemmatimonadales bacterium]|nr:response regulator [Gemmatimonadales bacterium]NIN12059.1 response regulator [Gemmatimonadales bacterium]NIR03294.1 response regulator [Gemmatimonadales bacterium]NIS66974.1 response regulator [Gemmatimonadales bacterium]
MGETKKTLGSVLVVEDEQDYAALLAAMLRDGGYEVQLAYDGMEALEKMQERVPDLITLDIRMPRKAGIRFFREIKSQPRFRDVPLVVVTGLTVGDRDMETYIRCFLEVEHLPRPDAYLEKPVEADQLLAVVGRAIRRRGEGDTTPAPLQGTSHTPLWGVVTERPNEGSIVAAAGDAFPRASNGA